MGAYAEGPIGTGWTPRPVLLCVVARVEKGEVVLLDIISSTPRQRAARLEEAAMFMRIGRAAHHRDGTGGGWRVRLRRSRTTPAAAAAVPPAAPTRARTLFVERAWGQCHGLRGRGRRGLAGLRLAGCVPAACVRGATVPRLAEVMIPWTVQAAPPDAGSWQRSTPGCGLIPVLLLVASIPQLAPRK